jgi:hypothetical protein
MTNKLEGFLEIDDETATCSFPDCKEKVVGSTVFTDKIKGLNVDKYHFWCKKHYEEVLSGRLKNDDR